MNWRDPKKELPKEGEIVAVLYQHPKKHKYMSSQIMFGEVEWAHDKSSCRVDSGDFTGQGLWSVYLKVSEEDYCDDIGIAWLPAKEFILPQWTPHNPHWGPV